MGIDDVERGADVRQTFGNQLYLQGNTPDEVDLGHAIFHQKNNEPLELSDDQLNILKVWVSRMPSYVMRRAFAKALGSE